MRFDRILCAALPLALIAGLGITGVREARAQAGGAGGAGGDGGSGGEGGEGGETSPPVICRAKGEKPLAVVPAGLRFAGASGSKAGSAVACGGDVDGDGFSDLLIGAPGAGKGSAALILGGPSSALAPAHLRLEGEAASHRAGSALSAGDIDGDGLSDIIVGAPKYSSGRGAAYIELSASAAWGVKNLGSSAIRIVGGGAGDSAGFSLDGVADLSGDLRPDIVVGAYAYDKFGAPNAGAIYIFNGPLKPGSIDVAAASAKLVGEGTGDLAGYSVAAAGDVNGDGHPDLLIGAPRQGADGRPDWGAVYLVYGPIAGAMSLAGAVKLAGESSGDLAGSAVSGAGDLNGDGFADVVIGAPGAAGGAGKVYLVYGSAGGPASGSLSGMASFAGAAADQLGFSVAGAGDLDGDGLDDVLAGAPGFQGKRGAVVILYGAADAYAGAALAAGLSSFVGEGADHLAGSAVAGAGDINADGRRDFIIGAPGAGSGAGAAYVILGRGPDVYFTDADGDTFGDPASPQALCEQRRGVARGGGDCDDSSADVNRLAAELCNGRDDNCDGLADDADPSVADKSVFHKDIDGDGHGDPNVIIDACEAPDASWVAAGDDCDDASAAINPGASELCNSVDDDCDGLVDDMDIILEPPFEFYRDNDGDGLGDAGDRMSGCSAPSGYVMNGADCDDADASAHGAVTWYGDADGDGYGAAVSPFGGDWFSITTCADLADPSVVSALGLNGRYALEATDCDDLDPAMSPGAGTCP